MVSWSGVYTGVSTAGALPMGWKPPQPSTT